MKRYFDFDMNDYKDKKCNFHSHTVRCQHAVGEEREYVEEAIKEGFEVIGFPTIPLIYSKMDMCQGFV